MTGVFSSGRDTTADKAAAAFDEVAQRQVDKDRDRKGRPNLETMQARADKVFRVIAETIEAIRVFERYIGPAPKAKRVALIASVVELVAEFDRVSSGPEALAKRALPVYDALLACAKAMRAIDKHIDKAPFRPLTHFRSQRALLEAELTHITESRPAGS